MLYARQKFYNLVYRLYVRIANIIPRTVEENLYCVVQNNSFVALSIQVHKSYFIRIGINGINNVVMEWPTIYSCDFVQADVNTSVYIYVRVHRKSRRKHNQSLHMYICYECIETCGKIFAATDKCTILCVCADVYV